MEINDIDILVVPSFTQLMNPFRSKLYDIVSNEKNKNKIFIFANVAKYGGSGIYNFSNRREYEPGKESILISYVEDYKPYFINNSD